MKKFMSAVFVLFVGILNVYAESIDLDISKITDDSVTLKVNTDKATFQEICYVYRSDDDINFDKKIIINCNESYIDKELNADTTYYYKASIEGSDSFSEVITVVTEKEEVIMVDKEKAYSTMKNGVVVGVFTFLFISFVVLVVSMFIFKRKLDK